MDIARVVRCVGAHGASTELQVRYAVGACYVKCEHFMTILTVSMVRTQYMSCSIYVFLSVADSEVVRSSSCFFPQLVSTLSRWSVPAWQTSMIEALGSEHHTHTDIHITRTVLKIC